MKFFTILIIFILSTNIYAQTEYYSTDSKNRLTETELNELMSQISKSTSTAMKKEMFVSVTIKNTIKRKDSIINVVTFIVKDKKTKNKSDKEFLSNLKNKEFPNFNLKSLKGDNFDSKKLKGKPTMINFWFTKCAPCIDEMPVLNRIKEKYKDDFNFIAITYEKKEDVKNFLKKHPFNFEHLINAENFTNQLGIKAYPMNLFLDKNGVLKYVRGGIPYESKEGEELKVGEGNEIIEIIEKLK